MNQHAVSLGELRGEIDLIAALELRDCVHKAVHAIGVRAWQMPSSVYHHLPDERVEWGNLVHTLRVVRVCAVLSDILLLVQRERDILRSAAVLHDICKYGIDADAERILTIHPLLVRQFLDREGIVCDPLVLTCIESHMGRWGSERCDWMASRQITLPFLLHIADCIVARLGNL